MKTRAWLAAAAMVAGIGLAACGGSDDGDGGDGGGTDNTIESSTDDKYPDRNEFVELTGVPGVTATEIQFASIATKQNNPLGIDIKDAFNNGIKAYFDWRNEEGGAYGRQLVLASEADDELTLNQAKALEVIGANNRFGVFVSTLVFSGAKDLNDAGIPTFVWNISPTEFADRPSIFGHIGAGCTGCTSRVGPYLASISGATKIASLGYGVSENSKICAQSAADAFRAYADELGYEVVYVNDSLGFGLPNGIGPEVTEMKNLGVDFITSCMDLNGMKTLGAEAQRQGLEVTMQHPNSYSQTAVAESAGAWEGDFVLPQFAAFEYETDLALQAKFFEYMEKNNYEIAESAMIGWILADQVFTGLMEAGPEFSQQAVIDALNSLTAYSAGGLINPIDWTRQHTPVDPDDPSTGYAKECFSPVQVKDNTLVPVGDDPSKPFLCWDNSTKDWSEPEPTSFGE
jgi:ABC-type branched-subunit amino acid transport system substrate-binding protein